MNRLVLFFLFLILNFSTYGQAPEKQTHSREQLWLAFFNQTRFNERWGGWLDVQYRMTGNFVERPFQFLFRPAITYFITDNLRANFGYALIKHYPGEGLNNVRTEHRPWQQIWWSQKYPGLSTLQWIRFEQRFNEKVVADVRQDGYNYNFRVRYNLSFMVPLKGKEMAARVPFAVVINELFVNLGQRIVYNTFDQNRLFAGFGYNFTQHLNCQFGYLNVYQQESAGNIYAVSHSIRLALLHSLDLRRED